MSLIYSSDYLKIMEEKNKIFKIIFSYPAPIIINSLLKTKIIQGGTSTNDFKTIKFKADSVKSLDHFQEENKKERGKKQLNINEVASLIKTLTTQLSYLITTENRTILGYSPENIIVINGKTFVHIGSEVISNKLENNMALISYPFTPHDFFISPELLTIKELPSYIHYKTSYFSLGCLALYTILSDNEFYINYLKEQELNQNKELKQELTQELTQELKQELKQELTQKPINLENLLKYHPIKHTKLYWLLSRCLMKDPYLRSILFI